MLSVRLLKRRHVRLVVASLIVVAGLAVVASRPFGAPFPSNGSYPAARYVVGRLVQRGADVRIIPFPWIGAGLTVTNAYSPVTEAAIAERTGHWVKVYGPVLGNGSTRGLLVTWLNGRVILDLNGPLPTEGLTAAFEARLLTDEQRSCLATELGVDAATAYIDGTLTELTTVHSLSIGQCLTIPLPSLPEPPPPLDAPASDQGSQP